MCRNRWHFKINLHVGIMKDSLLYPIATSVFIILITCRLITFKSLGTFKTTIHIFWFYMRPQYLLVVVGPPVWSISFNTCNSWIAPTTS